MLTTLMRGACTRVRGRLSPIRLRASFAVVRGWADVARELSAGPPPLLVLADVDPAVDGWGASARRLMCDLARVEATLAELGLARGGWVWVTNTDRVEAQLGPPPHHSPAGRPLLLEARKPLLGALRRRLPRLACGPQTVVIGDQWLTDGVLAWRLRARLLLWVSDGRRPVWAAAQYWVGYLVVRPLFNRRGGRRSD